MACLFVELGLQGLWYTGPPIGSFKPGSICQKNAAALAPAFLSSNENREDLRIYDQSPVSLPALLESFGCLRSHNHVVASTCSTVSVELSPDSKGPHLFRRVRCARRRLQCCR